MITMHRVVSRHKTFNRILAATNFGGNITSRSFHTLKSVNSWSAFGGQRSICSNETWSRKVLLKPLVFTAFVGCASHTAAMLWQCGKNEKITEGDTATSVEPNHIKLRNWWRYHSGAAKTIIPLIALMNGAVFLMWKRASPRLSILMQEYFIAGPFQAVPCTPMILCAFSQNELRHLLSNMFILWVFGPFVVKILGPEQFLASYITAAAVSAFGSYVYNVNLKIVLPTMGASGVMSFLFGVWVAEGGESQRDITMLIPIYHYIFKFLKLRKFINLLMDIIGFTNKHSQIDHAMHIAGFIFGLWYSYIGRKWYQKFEVVASEKWKAIRSHKSGKMDE